MKTDTITIGALKFTEQTPPQFRGGPRCVFTRDAKGRGSVRFNMVLMAESPELKKCAGVAVYMAADKPALLLVPSEDGARIRDERSGARKLCGSPLRALASKYRRVVYRLEAIKAPREGWLLTPTESEKL